MGVALVLTLRICQTVFALTVLSLSAYVANWYNTDTLMSSPSHINFLIFSPLWTLLSIAYLEGSRRLVPKAWSPHTSIGLELINLAFWLCGFSTLGVFLSRLLFCRGVVCAVAQADACFAALSFVAWAITLILACAEVFKAGHSKSSTVAVKTGKMMDTLV